MVDRGPVGGIPAPLFNRWDHEDSSQVEFKAMCKELASLHLGFTPKVGGGGEIPRRRIHWFSEGP